jgi:hypothetical protein
MTRVTLRIGDSSRHRTDEVHGHHIDAFHHDDDVWRAVLRQVPDRVLCESHRVSVLEHALARFTPQQLQAVLEGRPLNSSP